MKTSIVYSLTPYATSSFAGHSLLTVIGIVASSMAGAVYIPMAKALDLWGRAEGFLVMTVFCMLGIVLLAVSTNIQTYSAGEVRSNQCSKDQRLHGTDFDDKIGLLHSRLRRSIVQLGSPRSGRDQSAESRPSIRLHIFSGDHLCICGLESRSTGFEPVNVALGLRHVGDRSAILCHAGVFLALPSHAQGRKERHLGPSEEELGS